MRRSLRWSFFVRLGLLTTALLGARCGNGNGKCQSDSDCTPGVCIDGECEACLTDSDCEQGEVCRDSKCVEEVERCQGRQTCNDHGDCDDSSSFVACDCDTGYTGQRCEFCAFAYRNYGDGECRPSDPCAIDNPCVAQHRKCENDQGRPTCGTCRPGYKEDNNGVCVEQTYCGPDSCNGHGSCDDSSGAVVCTCGAGWAGAHCDLCAVGYRPDGNGDCVLEEHKKRRMSITAGSGTASSQHFRARLYVGAPQPFGPTTGSGRRLVLGPKPTP